MTQAVDDVVEDQVEADETELEAEDAEAAQGETPEEAEADAGNDEEAADEVIVTIEGESPPPDEEESRAPAWVKELRKSSRETARLLRERTKELEELKAGRVVPAETTVLGEKPTLAACDYDADDFESKLSEWHERKRSADAERAQKEQAARAQEKAWQDRLAHHNKLMGALNLKDPEDVQAFMEENFSLSQRGLIVHAADNSAQVFAALRGNPGKAKELAAITDPVQFTAAFAKLETKLKVTPRKAAPLPEKTVKGSGPLASSSDAHLERLREKAAKTGDMSEVIAYRAKLASRQT